MEEVAVVGEVQAHNQDHVYVRQEEADSMTPLEWEHWTVIERVVDGDTPHLLPLQEVEVAAVAAVVVFVVLAAAEADSEAVELVFVVVMLPAAEAEMKGAEWNEPVSRSAEHKANETRCLPTTHTFYNYRMDLQKSIPKYSSYFRLFPSSIR